MLTKWTEANQVLAMSFDKHSIDTTDILKPGIYILSLNHRVVYVGRAKCMLAAVADHRSAVGAPRLPEWFPVKAVRFDSIAIIPMPYERTFPLAQALIEFHQPSHNIYSRPVEQIQSPPPPATKPATTINRRI